MKIEHLGIWVKNLDSMKDFYTTYFDTELGEKYHNPSKNLTSYFISFKQGCRLELMYNPTIGNALAIEHIGLAHFAISMGSEENVNRLTEVLRNANYKITSEPRTTGDGYYESVILDPEGNHIELTV